MKIISKYKDYYDWCVGKYGIDDKMILDRRKNYYPKVREYENQNEVQEYKLAICGEIFEVSFYKGKSYHTKVELETLRKKTHKGKLPYKRLPYWYNRGYWDSLFDKNHKKTEANDKLGIPTLMKIGGDDWQGVLLNEFNVQKYIPAEEMYQKVYSWISSRKDVKIENNQTDKEKILSHGLDYVKSFRHRK